MFVALIIKSATTELFSSVIHSMPLSLSFSFSSRTCLTAFCRTIAVSLKNLIFSGGKAATLSSEEHRTPAALLATAFPPSFDETAAMTALL